MLTADQKAEAEKKLKSINEEMAQQEEIKSKIKKFTKTLIESVNSIKQDPKKQIELLKNLNNSEFVQKIAVFQNNTAILQELQEKMKNKRDQLNREALFLVEEKSRFERGIDEIKSTIVNIQKTVKNSVEEQSNKRKKIQEDLQKSLDDIRNKITEFEGESQKFDKENAELQGKINEIKGKLSGIEENFKVKAEEKDSQTKQERQELTEKLKVLEIQVQKATELNKEFAALEKQNFDNKIAVYLKTKKFPEYFSSFESSAKTLNSCKQELLKGVHRMNVASQTIEQNQKISEEISKQFLLELKRQKEREARVEEIKREKEGVRGNIIVLQNKLKEKKAKLG